MEARAITARLAAAPADIANVSMGDATDYHPGWVYHGLIVGTAMDAASLLRQLLQVREPRRPLGRQHTGLDRAAGHLLRRKQKRLAKSLLTTELQALTASKL